MRAYGSRFPQGPHRHPWPKRRRAVAKIRRAEHKGARFMARTAVIADELDGESMRASTEIVERGSFFGLSHMNRQGEAFERAVEEAERNYMAETMMMLDECRRIRDDDEREHDDFVRVLLTGSFWGDPAHDPEHDWDDDAYLERMESMEADWDAHEAIKEDSDGRIDG